jgi:hypothetical protein
MTSAETTEVADIVRRVQSWPVTLRIALARRILETLEAPPVPDRSANQGHGLSAAEVMAKFRPVVPTPSDEECERVLEEELSKKYGL